MDPRKTPLTCYHCGNTGILTYIDGFEAIDDEEERNWIGQLISYSVISKTKWHLYKCPVCENPVLANQTIWGGEPPGCLHDLEIVFPGLNIDKENTPRKIIKAYEAAVKTRGIDNAICLLSLRRALEMVCKDKNAEGKNLESKIDDLIEKKVLPEMMRDACWIVRQCGNEAAHADDVEFSKREADEAIEYVGSIVTYLYSTPVKVADLRRRIEERQKK